MACDPETLSEAAKCNICAGTTVEGGIEQNLLCQIAGGVTPAGPCYLTDEDGNLILDDQGNQIEVPCP